MREKRLLSLIAASAFCALSMNAQTNLAVQLKSGTTQKFDISSINKMLVSSQSLAVYTTDVNAFTISDIQSLKFVQVATGISAVNGNGLAVNRQGDRLTITGAKPDDQVSVYSVNGQTVGHFRATEEGTLNLSGLRRGVYIMKINNKTIKISK